MFTVPIRSTSVAVTPAPTIPPKVPPTPMKPNSRLACSLLKRSAMKHQNTDTTNRLKTLIQTKNTRLSQTSPAKVALVPKLVPDS